MGISNGQLLSVSKDIVSSVTELTEKLAQGQAQLITVYYGKDPSESEIQAVTSAISEKCPEAETEAVFGGQSVYNYYVSVE